MTKGLFTYAIRAPCGIAFSGVANWRKNVSEAAGGLLILGNNVYVEFAYLTSNVRSNYWDERGSYENHFNPHGYFMVNIANFEPLKSN